MEGYNLPQSYYYLNSVGELYDFQNEWKTILDFNWEFTEGLSLITNTVINLNTSAKSRRFINIRDAFIKYQSKSLDLRLGRQLIDWSELSGWSPIDMPNTMYYYDFLNSDDEEIGRWAFNGFLYQDQIVFNFTLLPFFRSSELYFNNNRWIRPPETLPLNGMPVSANFSGTNDQIFKNEWQFGASINLPIGNVQNSLIYYNGLNDIPVRTLDVTSGNSSELNYQIGLVYHRLEQISYQNSFFLGQWNLWSELNYTRTRISNNDDIIPHKFYNLTAGLDRQFDLKNESELHLLLQYIYAFNNDNVEYANNDLDHIFNNAIVGKIDFTVNYNLAILLRFAGDFKTSGYYLNPEIQYNIGQALTLRLRSDFLFGDSMGFFGNYSDNTRVGLAVQHYF
ncbi:MAG: hypothetical protein HKN00_05835 [Flavobacteriaceae bacterium]|nr:hypothetical protein [Flavobacteriaceae bacterium]